MDIREKNRKTIKRADRRWQERKFQKPPEKKRVATAFAVFALAGMMFAGLMSTGISSAAAATTDSGAAAAMAGTGMESSTAAATSAEAAAISSTFKCEVYNTTPATMTVIKGKTKSVKKVNKYVFKVKNLETFSSLEKIIKALDGKTCKPSGFTWVSKNEKIAKVGSRGKVTGVKPGTTYIYPIPNSVCGYRIKGRCVIYTDINILNGLKASGAFALKVKVTK